MTWLELKTQLSTATTQGLAKVCIGCDSNSNGISMLFEKEDGDLLSSMMCWRDLMARTSESLLKNSFHSCAPNCRQILKHQPSSVATFPQSPFCPTSVSAERSKTQERVSRLQLLF